LTSDVGQSSTERKWQPSPEAPGGSDPIWSSEAFFLKGAGTFSYPVSTVLPASAAGTITADARGITACAAVSGETGAYGFSMSWAGVFTSFDTGNWVLPTT